MSISSFEDLLRTAREQPQPQRLLFVFAGAALPDDCTPDQHARYRAGQGGALIPLMSVDKRPDDLSTFAALVEESCQFGREWAIVFVASLSGRDGRAPSSADADRSLRNMIESIQTGAIASFMPFNRLGEPVLLN